MRFRVQGTTARGRLWADGVQDEPAAWQIEATDSTLSAPGRIGFFGFDANTHLCLRSAVSRRGRRVRPVARRSGGPRSIPHGSRRDGSCDQLDIPLGIAAAGAGARRQRISSRSCPGAGRVSGAMPGPPPPPCSAGIGSRSVPAVTARRAFVYWPLGRMQDCDMRARVLTTSGTNNQIRLHARLGDYQVGATATRLFHRFRLGRDRTAQI